MHYKTDDWIKDRGMERCQVDASDVLYAQQKVETVNFCPSNTNVKCRLKLFLV
jgi:hypothetical protein